MIMEFGNSMDRYLEEFQKQFRKDKIIKDLDINSMYPGTMTNILKEVYKVTEKIEISSIAPITENIIDDKGLW